MASSQSSHRSTRESTMLDVQKANVLPAEVPRPIQESPEEAQRRDDMTPTKSVVINPHKGQLQIGTVRVPTV